MNATVYSVIDAVNEAVDKHKSQPVFHSRDLDFELYDGLGGADALKVTETQWYALLDHVRTTMESDLTNLDMWGGVKRPEAVIVGCVLLDIKPDVFGDLKAEVDYDSLFGKWDRETQMTETLALDLAFHHAKGMVRTLGWLLFALSGQAEPPEQVED